MSKYASTSKSGLPTSGVCVEESLEASEKRDDLNFITRNIFPIIAEVNRSIPAPPFLLWFQHFILFLQLLFGSYFLFHPIDNVPRDFYVIVKVLFFGMAGDYNTFTPFFLSLAAADFVTFVFLIIVLIDYHNNHEFKMWQLYILRIWHGLLFSYLIIPNIFFVSISLASLGSENTWEATFIFLFSLVTILYTYGHVIFISNLLNQSPFLFHGMSFHWRPPELFRLVIIMSLPYALDGFFQKTQPWLRFAPPVITILIAPFFLYKMWFLPFTYLFSNVAWASLSVGLIFGAIFAIIRDFDLVELSIYIQILSPIIALIGSWAIIWPLFYFHRRQIKSQLSYSAFPEDASINEENKQKYLQSLNLTRKSTSFTYIQIGIEEGADLFLDWSLSKYIVDHFEGDNDLLIFMTWAVSFFPSETFSMHNFILNASKIKNPSLINRAMFYQLHRLHIFRQSSSSKEANSDLSKIKKMSEQCISAFCQIWRNLTDQNFELTPHIYHLLTRMRHTTEASWAEILDKYPNNARFANEYASFLLDGRCQFKDAIRYHQRANAIEQGNRMQNDRMFHRFVQMFPFYLKQGIVDTSGKLKRKLQNSGQDNATSFADAMQNENTSEDSSDDIDMVEGEQYIPQAQLRLALGRAVSELHSNISHKVMITAIVSLVLTLIYVIVIGVMLHHKFDEISRLFSYLKSISKISQTYDILVPIITWSWAKKVYTAYDDDEEYEIFGSAVYEMSNYLNIEASDDQKIYNLSLIGLSYIDKLSRDLYHSDSSFGERIVNLTRLISNTPVNGAICNPLDNRVIYENQSITIDYLWRSLFMSSSKLTMDSDTIRDEWEKSNVMCETLLKSDILAHSLRMIPMNVSKAFSYEYELLIRCNVSHFIFDDEGKPTLTDEFLSPYSCPDPVDNIGYVPNNADTNYFKIEPVNNIYNFLIAFSPFLILTLVLPSTVFMSSGLLSEKIDFTKHLNSFTKQECDKASERINQNAISQNETDTTLSQDTKTSDVPNFFVNVLCALVIVALLLVQLICSTTFSNKLSSILEHYIFYCTLRNAIFDASQNTLLMIFLHQARIDGHFVPKFTNDTNLRLHVNEVLQVISLVQSMLAHGFGNVPSAFGFISDIDQIMYKEHCQVSSDIKYILEYYQCISFDRIVSYFVDMIRTLTASLESEQIISKETYLFGKLLDTRLALGFLELLNQYEETFDQTIYIFRLIVWICFSIVTICTILTFVVELMIVVVIERELDTFKCLLLRVNPVSFATNAQALSLVYGKKSFVDTHIISASHSVFYSSQDAMMSLNQDGIIESLNPSASEIFGYTPEQMLGQNIKLLINPEIKNNNQLYYTMQLMKSGQCGLIFEADFAGSRDDETILPLKVTLLGFSSNDRVAGSFAIVCRDKTEEDKQKEEVENAQKESENLLLQFVPKDMLSRINKDEQELAFTVPSSTVIFLNISQFSVYMSTLSPSELLMNLGKIFSSFDKIIANIPSITKIKIMGDIYFAAGGLFATSDTPPSTHANDVASFATKALDSIEELNIQMNASLQIRIGVHTGGPITAGVLGADKQIFDIIGSTITACQQLEETCVPGNINISNDTYQLIQSGPYQIEVHMEMELKGVGKQMTYTISPGHMAPSASSSTAYTPPSLDALLSGGSSAYTVPSLDALVGPSDYPFDSIAAFPEDEPSLAGDDNTYQIPSLASLIDPAQQM